MLGQAGERTKYEAVRIALSSRQYYVFVIRKPLMLSVRFSNDTGWISRTTSRNTRKWRNIGINNWKSNSMVWPNTCGYFYSLIAFLLDPKYYTARKISAPMLHQIFSLVRDSYKRITWPNIPHWGISEDNPQFSNSRLLRRVFDLLTYPLSLHAEHRSKETSRHLLLSRANFSISFQV